MSYTQKQYKTLHDLCNTLILDIVGNRIDISTVSLLLTFAMGIVQEQENYQNLKGPAKKQLVISVVTDIMQIIVSNPGIVDAKISKRSRKAISSFIRDISVIIDGIVDFSHSKIGGKAINRRVRCWKIL